MNYISKNKTDYLNITVSIKEIKCVVKNYPTKKTPGPNNFIGECYQIFKEVSKVCFCKNVYYKGKYGENLSYFVSCLKSSI